MGAVALGEANDFDDASRWRDWLQPTLFKNGALLAEAIQTGKRKPISKVLRTLSASLSARLSGELMMQKQKQPPVLRFRHRRINHRLHELLRRRSSMLSRTRPRRATIRLQFDRIEPDYVWDSRPPSQRTPFETGTLLMTGVVLE